MIQALACVWNDVGVYVYGAVGYVSIVCNAVVVAVFDWAKSDGVSVTTRDSRNSAIGRDRNGALTVVVATPSQNGAIFESDGVCATTRDSSNAAIGRGRNVALT